MKQPNPDVEPFRLKDALANSLCPPELGGAYRIPYRNESGHLGVIMSTHADWDHVSVSLPHRCPTWQEMNYVKSLFFRPEETVVQYHPAESNYVNVHPYCLHLWRPQRVEIPVPPTFLVY